MFNALGTNLNKIFDKLRGRGILTEADVKVALRDIRVALLEADVALSVVKALIDQITIKAIGVEVLKSVQPGHMVAKIVHDELMQLMHSDNQHLNLAHKTPVVIMMVGLQGAGKTTTAAKIALYIKQRHHKKVLMASLDTQRPAAQRQLEILGKQVAIATLPIIEGQSVQIITERALFSASLEGFDILILDTAGRLHIDGELMSELSSIANTTSPAEVLIVADAMIGQEAARVAQDFQNYIALTGIVLTKADSDARGGAALSMRYVTNCPIKFIGIGEKINDLEEFHADRIVSKILGMGDIVSLVEKASEAVTEAEMQKLSKKVQKGSFDLDDLLAQFKVMHKMGGITSIISMIPGMGKLQQQVNIKSGESMLARQEAIIQSMTKMERKNPKILNPSRKHRIAKGSGVSLQEINRLLKQHLEMQSAMKKLSKASPFQLQQMNRLFSSGRK